MKDISIEHITIGDDHRPFIIAEMSGNHNQSFERAKEIISSAAACGAHAIKLQTYTADTMTVPGALTIDDGSPWNGRELHELYREAYTPWAWHEALFSHARSLGLIAFSTPFDETAVDFLEELHVPAYKIASFENTDWPLLARIARTGKPVIMSTGVSTLADLDDAVSVLRKNGCKDLVLLKCTSTYPATPENSNLLTIPHMRQLYDCTVGLSDHTMGIGASVAAVALGARVIEKHFTLNRKDGGVDSTFSIEPSELSALVTECERAFIALGNINYGIQESEKSGMVYKRSIYIITDMKAGETITRDHVKVIRPAYGMAPKYLEKILGKKVKTDVKAGTPLTWELL
jgi:pseudaminic acid synthase